MEQAAAQTANWTAVLLAGSRAGTDPVAAHCGVAVKALAEIDGEAMIRRVVRALVAQPKLARVLILGEENLLAPVVEDIDPAFALGWCASAGSPAASLARAFELLPEHLPVLVTTADHALLEPEWVQRFLEASEKSGADLCLAVTPAQAVREALPDSRRTVLEFSDARVCTCNLFAFCRPVARTVSTTWQKTESERKRPWRMLARLGFLNALLYTLGALSIDSAFARLSRRFGVRVQPVSLPWPLLALDVDTPQDLAECARIIKKRRVSGDRVSGDTRTTRPEDANES